MYAQEVRVKLDMPTLNLFAPTLKRALAVALVAVAIALLIFLAGVRTKRKAIRGADQGLLELNTQLNRMRGDIDHGDQQNKATRKAIEKRNAIMALGVLEPLLGSLAMRGKSLLDPIALQTGFHIDSVRELPPIPLQLPKPPPDQLYCRQPIEFTGQGSYTQIVAFVEQTEASNPLATLSGLQILAQPQNPERHKAVVTFEWPSKGEKSKTGVKK